MIWVDGQLVDAPDARLALLDRALEHGVGLFETMRAIGGRVPLLDRHLARLRRSAEALGLDTERARLPGGPDLAQYLGASSRSCTVRLTISGGSGLAAPVVWLVERPWEPPSSRGGVAVAGRFTVALDDELARHKTLNQWRRRRLKESAMAAGVFERIAQTPDGRVWEAIWANVFVVRGGVVMTPTLDGPVLPGIMRGLVLERAAALGIPAAEGDLHDLDGDEVFLTNAVRGVIPVARLDDRGLRAPGPVTELLRNDVEHWLEREAAR